MKIVDNEEHIQEICDEHNYIVEEEYDINNDNEGVKSPK